MAIAGCTMPMPMPESSYGRVASDSMASERPAPAGLGTKWGESRHSAVRDSHFSRQSSKPSAVASVYYNNKASSESGSRLRQPFRVGNKIATIGIRSKSGMGGYLPGYRRVGTNHVVGMEDQRYTIEIRNLTSSKIEVVLSVDGLDVIDGRSASYAKRGYIVEPHGKLEVDGFRKSHSEVAAFRFASIPDSYAARKHGDTRNVGVIGVAVFTQAIPWNQAKPFPGETGRFSEAP